MQLIILQKTPGNKAVITYIDFVAAFDSISHRFLDEALEEAEASDKSRAIFRAIYKSATAVVRVSPKSSLLSPSRTRL